MRHTLIVSTDQPLEPLPRVNLFGIWLKGAFISNVCGLACLAMLSWAASGFDSSRFGEVASWTSGTLVASTFLTLPFAMGFGAALFWKPANLSGKSRFWWTLGNLLLSLGGAALILREGSICLVMAAPLLLLLMGAGSAVGAHFWNRNSFLSASVLPVLMLLALYDASQPHFYAHSVVTQLHSDLPPQKLWRFVASYPRNEAPPEWWLWQLGLPFPIEARGEPVVGGRRDCNFSGGVSIGERVVSVVPGRRLEFVVDKQPNHPEVLHHFVLRRGRLELLPDGRGGTTMRGTSWYELKVYPAWYFGPWCDAVVHHVHERVFRHMDRLARQGSKTH